MSIETLLRDVAEKEVYKLEDMEMGTKEHAAAVEDIAKLTDKIIEIEKFKASEVQTEKQMRKDQINMVIKTCVDVGGLVLGAVGIGVTVWGTMLGYVYEEKGCISSQVGKKYTDRIMRFLK